MSINGIIKEIKRSLVYWRRVPSSEVPEWVVTANMQNPNLRYLRGKTFLYKIQDDAGSIQGEHIVTFYRKKRIR